MNDGRALRIALEVALLVALAVVLGLADVQPFAIVAVMALAWLIVVLVEWIAFREVPHYTSGSPPHFYLPTTPLPPPRPIEQHGLGFGYPQPRGVEAPTWAVPSDLRAEIAGEWPVAVRPVELGPEPLAVPVPTLEAEPIEDEVPEFAPAVMADDPWHAHELPAEPELDGDVRLAVYRIDPFAESRGRRLWRRRPPEDGPVVELPVLPRHGRPPRS